MTLGKQVCGEDFDGLRDQEAVEGGKQKKEKKKVNEEPEAEAGNGKEHPVLKATRELIVKGDMNANQLRENFGENMKEFKKLGTEVYQQIEDCYKQRVNELEEASNG